MKLIIPERNGVILADPPWSYGNFSDSAHGAASAHYDTMDFDRIKDLKGFVDRRALKDCVLGLWGTWPKSDQAHHLLDAWGFKLVTGIPWVKTVPSSGTIRRSIGFWTMSATEFLLIARRGKPKRINVDGGKSKPIGLLIGDRPQECVFYHPIGKHSAKPLHLHDYFRHYCNGPYMEMFATSQREGWTCYGRKLGHEITPNGIKPYKVESDTRVVRGKNKARSKFHEPTKETVGLWT